MITDEIKSDKYVHQDFNSSNDNILKNDNTLEDFLISRLLRNCSVDFIWSMKNEPIKWKNLNLSTMISRFPRAEFTTKIGLCNNLQQSYWYYEENVSEILFPRCYSVSNDAELSEFVDNFKHTACISMIKFIHEAKINENIIFINDGTIPITVVNFAIQRCEEYIRYQQHNDIDQVVGEKVWDHQWDQFFTYYYLLIHENANFIFKEENEILTVQEKCKNELEQLRKYWPQLDLDGTNNLWILKPAAKSRGRGILIVRKLEDIFSKIAPSYSKDNKYVAQKYIERPLLIYETKFDIRQWFLVTCASPLTIWMYKESYLRFCSQLFSLTNTHESVHLSNNAIQCKYRNGNRDTNLPDENMWDCYTFQTYLRSKGQPEVWETIIYPGMRQNIIGTLLASQDSMDSRKNCFELFGADFMLSENFTPWLIEINSGPSMSPSTSVTARMCAQVLDDVIKVVVDRKCDKNADTGMFELVYKQIIPPAQLYMGQNLIAKGTRIGKPYRTHIHQKNNYFNKPKKRKSNAMAATIKYVDKFIFVENRFSGKFSYFDVLKCKPTVIRDRIKSNGKYRISGKVKELPSTIQNIETTKSKKETIIDENSTYWRTNTSNNNVLICEEIFGMNETMVTELELKNNLLEPNSRCQFSNELAGEKSSNPSSTSRSTTNLNLFPRISNK